MKNNSDIEQKYAFAKEKYELIGVDVDAALAQIQKYNIIIFLIFSLYSLKVNGSELHTFNNTAGDSSLPSAKSAAYLNLPKIFTNNMILQRNVNAPVWGTARSKERITVEFDNQTKSTIADKNGNWSVKLNPMKAGGPFKMKVSGTGGGSKNLKNIMVGDVWICAGQSNMNLDLKEIGLSKTGLKKINNINVREFRCAMPEGALNPENIDHSKWIPAGDTATKRFSAVAYYFAQKIQSEEKIPVGIIVMSCGATRAETWISMKILKKYSALKPMLNYWSEKMNDDKYLINFKPSIFYKSVVEPVIPFAVKGIVWYQGESNTLPDNAGRSILSRANEYETHMTMN